MKNSSDSSSSSNEFIKIHTAYSTLSDPDKCADYDRGIFRQPFVSYSSVLLIRRRPCTYSRYFSYMRWNWPGDRSVLDVN
ncbi:hypothetical protein LguiB_017745 [Lonicera macranthoides]